MEKGHLKKVCVGSEPVDQPVPSAELVRVSGVIHSLDSKQMPLAVVGASPSLLKVISDNRTDGRRFVVHQSFSEKLFLQCIRQAQQDIFGMVELTTIVEYVVHRLRNAVYEESEEKIVLCRCLRKGSIDFCDYRELLTDLIELWPTIRPFIRCTVNPEASGKSASVSTIALSEAFVLVLCMNIYTCLLCVPDVGDRLAFDC